MARRIRVGAFTRPLASRPVPTFRWVCSRRSSSVFRRCSPASTSLTTIHRLRAPGMTFFTHAPVSLGRLCHIMDANPGNAGAGSDIVARHPGACGRYRHLRPSQGRRSVALPTHVLDLLAPGGLHHDSARHGRYHGNLADVRPAHDLWLQSHRVFEHCDCRVRELGLGAPYVHERHE